ncbi:MAG: chemotaxis protein CheW [Proteobacteria bacterium]|nr:chemotaxis protein CheW [Pseudomonadota bacterium]
MTTDSVGRLLVEDILEQRARLLARPPRRREDREDRVHCLAFHLGAETWAADLSDILEVRPLPDITPVPGTPDFILGLVNLRGGIHPVVDLAPILGLPDREPSREPHIVRARVEAAGVETSICFLADGRPWSMNAPGAGLSPAPDTLPDQARAFVRGSLPGPVLILDLARLLGDQRLVVDQE